MICCLVALGITGHSPLRADDVAQFIQLEPDHDHNHDHDHHQQVLESQKARFKRHLAVRIADLKRVCDLDDKQTKKLEVASKGAVEEGMKQFVQRFPQLKLQAQPVPPPAAAGGGFGFPQPIQRAVGQLRVAVAPPADVPVEADVEAQIDVEPVDEQNPNLVPLPQIDIAPVAEAIPAQVLVAPQLVPAQPLGIWNVNVHHDFQMEPSEAANTVIWRNAVQRVLTDSQREAYRNAQTERRLFKRKTIVDRVVASVDRRLFLSDQQRKDLAEVINDTVAENLDNMVPHGGFTSDATVAAQVVGQVPREKLKGVLDPAQIESWSDVQQVQQGVVFGFR
jgi:hypothetical protein